MLIIILFKKKLKCKFIYMETINGNVKYNYITNPKNGKKVKLNSKQGMKIMNTYIKNMYGG